jgi:hypothetical protein
MRRWGWSLLFRQLTLAAAAAARTFWNLVLHDENFTMTLFLNKNTRVPELDVLSADLDYRTRIPE